MKSKNLLLIFTRNPVLGKVKSRLAKDVGEQKALDIYKFLLDHTNKVTKELEVDKQVWYSENVNAKDIWSKDVYTKKEQLQVGDLGSRMEHAFRLGFEEGYKKIIIIGSDLHDISAFELEQAFKSLDVTETVIGPAEDGGFYLLGMKKIIPAIFKNKHWGNHNVLSQTLEDLEGYTLTKLKEKNDVDYLSDIRDNNAFQHFFN